jgi:hypothetical protein
MKMDEDIRGGSAPKEITPETAGAEMADSYEPQGDSLSEDTSGSRWTVDSTIKGVKRISTHPSTGIKKIEVWTTGRTGKTMLGSEAVGGWKTRGYRVDGKFFHQHKDAVNHLKSKTQDMKECVELDEDLTDKTIKPNDKIKVARVIADMLGVEKADSLSPEAAIEAAMRKVKTKRITPDMAAVLKKMVELARDVGVKVNDTSIPKSVSEAMVVRTKQDNISGDILRSRDHMRLAKANQGVVEPVDPSEVGHTLEPDDHLRRMKVKMKTEDVASADYKVGDGGRKYPAHRVTFKASGAQGNPTGRGEDPNKNHSVNHKPLLKPVREDVNIDEDDLNDIANDVDGEEDVLDVYCDDELTIVDADTGECVECDEEVNEQALMEVLSRIERMRAKMRFARSSAKRSRRLQIVLHRHSDTKTLNKRARRLAVNLLKQKMLKKPVSQMTVDEKERVEKMLAQRKGLIDRLAMKLIPRVRKIENERLSHPRVTKKQ